VIGDLDLSPDTLGRHLSGYDVTGLLITYGYGAVLLFVAVESMGIPVPGETMLLAASVYAGTTHHLQIALVILAAAVGAILGDNAGFVVGREGGYRLLRRYGHYVRLDERKLALGQYLFERHGGKVVFFGRFVAVLRIWAAFLAGTYRLPWRRFLLYNAAGGITWATAFGLGGYLLGDNVHRLGGPIGIAGGVLAVLLLATGMVTARRHERRRAVTSGGVPSRAAACRQGSGGQLSWPAAHGPRCRVQGRPMRSAAATALNRQCGPSHRGPPPSSVARLRWSSSSPWWA